MEELYIPVLILKSGSATDDLYYEGDKDDLMHELTTNELITFYAKDEDGHRASEVVIRSENIDVIELDTPDEAAEEIRKVKEDTAKVVDITGLLEKLSKIGLKKPEMDSDDDSDFEELIKHIDDSHWINIKFRPVAKELYDLLKENFDKDSVPELFFALIGFAMDAADTTAFILNVVGTKKGDEIVAREVIKAIHSWLKTLCMDEEIILNTLKANKDKDYLMDAVFGAALEEMKAEAKD